jgi:death-on-curing protein
LRSDRVQFLTLEEALAIQDALIRRFGGAQGVRDPGLLESALFRPQTGYYEDLVQMAAALMESLPVNHSFVDGNKRIAFFGADVFLRLNGWKLVVDQDEAYSFILRILSGEKRKYQVLERWLRDHVVQLT